MVGKSGIFRQFQPASFRAPNTTARVRDQPLDVPPGVTGQVRNRAGAASHRAEPQDSGLWTVLVMEARLLIETTDPNVMLPTVLSGMAGQDAIPAGNCPLIFQEGYEIE